MRLHRSSAVSRSRPHSPAARHEGPGGTTGALLDLQRTAGNRAVTTLVAQRDAPKAPATTPYEHAYQGYWRLQQDLLHLNAKVNGGIRTDWIDELSVGLAELGDPDTAKPATIASLEQRLVGTKEGIDAHVAAAKAEWKDVWKAYGVEQDRLRTEGSKTDLEALRILDLRAKDTQDTVFKAYQYLTFDDIAGLESTLANNSHVRWATNQDEADYRAKKRAEAAKLPHFRSFRMRTLASGAVSVGPIGGEVTTIELVEVGDKGRTGYLTFVASGLALGFEAGAQGPQSWTDFKTPDPMRIEEFAGPGRMSSVGGHVVYGATYSWVHFYPAAASHVEVSSSGHGWGLGGGLSTTAGTWELRRIEKE